MFILSFVNAYYSIHTFMHLDCGKSMCKHCKITDVGLVLCTSQIRKKGVFIVQKAIDFVEISSLGINKLSLWVLQTTVKTEKGILNTGMVITKHE